MIYHFFRYGIQSYFILWVWYALGNTITSHSRYRMTTVANNVLSKFAFTGAKVT
jgi:hypothetical protein